MIPVGIWGVNQATGTLYVSISKIKINTNLKHLSEVLFFFNLGIQFSVASIVACKVKLLPRMSESHLGASL